MKFEANGTLADARQTGNLTIGFQRKGKGQRQLNLQTGDFPLAMFERVVARFAPHTRLAGTATGRIDPLDRAGHGKFEHQPGRQRPGVCHSGDLAPTCCG